MANAEQEAQEPIPGSNYHYWHDKVAQGDSAAPQPEHTPIAVAAAVSAVLPTVSIEDFGIMVCCARYIRAINPSTAPLGHHPPRCSIMASSLAG